MTAEIPVGRSAQSRLVSADGNGIKIQFQITVEDGEVAKIVSSFGRVGIGNPTEVELLTRPEASEEDKTNKA